MVAYDPKQNYVLVKIMLTHTKVFVIETIDGSPFCFHTIGFSNNLVNALGIAMQMMIDHEAYWIEVTKWGKTVAIVKNEDEALDALFQSCKW